MASSSSSIPANPPKVSSEDIISQKTDLCISNAIVKSGLGFGTGVLLSVILFRRRAFPVWLGTGFGLGSAWTDCERSFNPVAIPGVRILPSPNHPNAPSSGQPSVFEKLSEKTSDLVEKGKGVAQQASIKGKEVAQDAQQKGKEVKQEIEEKASNQSNTKPKMFIVFSALEESEKKVNESQKQDCFSCRVIGFATCLALSGFCFTEAFRLYPGVKADRSIVRMPPSNPKSPTPMPSIKSRSNHVFNVRPTPKIPSNVRLRFYSFMILGTGTSFAGIYRLMM